MLILLHTSKTMRESAENSRAKLTVPTSIDEARSLTDTLKSLSIGEVQYMMKTSSKLAEETKTLIGSWTDKPSKQRAAIDSFLGDIYSGLQVQGWSEEDRGYAQKNLRILSGLYGVLKPLDGIYPYRHEMGYKIPRAEYKSMYAFWGAKIADTLPDDGPIVNLTAVEYGKTVTKYVDADRIITPKFLTVSAKTGEPTFVTVHAKIARGAFARWLILHRIDKVGQLRRYSDLGYQFSESLSTALQPVYVCRKFEGLGLSVRLTKDTLAKSS